MNWLSHPSWFSAAATRAGMTFVYDPVLWEVGYAIQQVPSPRRREAFELVRIYPSLHYALGDLDILKVSGVLGPWPYRIRNIEATYIPLGVSVYRKSGAQKLETDPAGFYGSGTFVRLLPKEVFRLYAEEDLADE